VLQQHIAEQTHQDTSQEQKTLLTYKQIRAYLSDKDFLEDIYGIGTKIITDLVEFCETNKEVFEELDAWWVERYNLWTHKVIGSSLAWKTFVITGTFPYKREHIVAILEQEGAKEQNTVSKKTDFVLIWENAWSKKDKAEKLKIPLYVGRDAIVQYLAILQTIETANKESLTETQWLFS